jgi:hypothetical protein
MTEETHPLGGMTDEALQALLQRAIRDTLILGLISAAVLWIASGWRNAAMLAVGTAISAASILEWQRLVRFVNAQLDHQKMPGGSGSHSLRGRFMVALNVSEVRC